jgi:arginyl-tRNA--protein-N-Asp/Glu arginylyltransferase
MAGSDDERPPRHATTDRRAIREGEGEPSRLHKRSNDPLLDKDTWVYHKSGGVVAHHPNVKCNTCREYTMHRAMEEYSLNKSLEKVIEEHAQAVSERYVRDLADAESKLRRYRIKCDNDRHEILKLQDKPTQRLTTWTTWSSI